jgi:hypothetical protein
MGGLLPSDIPSDSAKTDLASFTKRLDIIFRDIPGRNHPRSKIQESLLAIFPLLPNLQVLVLSPRMPMTSVPSTVVRAVPSCDIYNGMTWEQRSGYHLRSNMDSD